MTKLISKIPTNPKTVGRHIVFITAYYLYEIGMLYAYTGHGVYLWDALIHLIVNLCFFYFNAHVVLSYSSSRTSRLTAILCAIAFITLELLLFLIAKYLVNTLFPDIGIPTSRPFQNWETFLRDVLWRFIYLFGLSTAYWFSISSAAKQRQLASLEHTRLRELAQQEVVKQDLLATENAFLRAQINSHFLFNTLSYLHASVHDLNQEVGKTILHLSSILRYSFSTTADGKVSLADELNHISHIFNITRIKSSKPLQLEYSVTGTPGNQQIIPLILVTLAENMLKYADFRTINRPAKFICSINQNCLSIHITNSKRSAYSPFSSGIGMENLKKRLILAYHDHYTLDVVNSESNYQLKLIIPLNDAI